MTAEFLDRDSLFAAMADRSYDRSPAIVCNAHYTGLAVARALDARGVPVIALDRSGDGVAPPSTAVDVAGEVTYPLDDRDGFRDDLERVADELGHEPVVFPCMDEWAHAVAATEPAGVRRPFADFDVIDAVLDKERLYERAADLGVPTPETYRLDETDPDAAADELGFPLVLKPALKRRFEEAFDTNLVEVESREAYRDVVDRARDAGLRVMAQEAVPKGRGDLFTLASYVPEAGVDEAATFVGNRRAVYPPGFGTSCLVSRADAPAVEERALAVLDDAGYRGISEAEFIYDERRDEYLLIDVNTRPWKWIELPVQAGANLPAAAYADVTGESYGVGGIHDATWVSLKDYVALLANYGAPDDLSRDQWEAILSGSFEGRDDLTTAVYRPSDPGPAYQLLATEFSGREYYCSC